MVSSSQTSIYNLLESFMARHRVLILFIYTFTIVWVAFFASKVIGEITYGTEAMGKLYSLIGSLPLIGILAFRRYFIEQGRAVFWKKFSLRNNWSYSPTLDLSKESAVLLKQGNSGRSAKYELRKIIDGRQIRIFYYTFTVSAGKHTYTYSYTVFGFTFNGSFPHLYLDRNLNTYGVNNTTLVRFGVNIDLPPVSLPTEFEQKFKLYVPEKYEIEALQIFTPDILAHLLDINFKYDIEFVDQEVLVFIDGEIDSLDKLEKEFEVAKKIRDLLAPTLNSIKFSPIGDRPHYLSR